MKYDPTIFNLPPAERLELAQALWGSLEAQDVPIPPEHMAELHRRLEAEASGKMAFASWDEVKKEIISKL